MGDKHMSHQMPKIDYVDLVDLPLSFAFPIKLNVIKHIMSARLFYYRSKSEFLRIFLFFALPLISIDYALLSMVLVADYFFILLHPDIPHFVFEHDAYEILCDIDEEEMKIKCLFYFKGKPIFKVKNATQSLEFFAPMILDLIENPSLEQHKLNYLSRRIVVETVKDRSVISLN